nr:SDR family NAD(P)-dependent oxidoreductase [Streptomyces sp. SLBN-31]
MNVARRVAIVTGGAGGIGSALVARLAREGARVVVTDLDADSARAVSDRVNADHPGSTVSAGADASDTPQIQELIDLAESTFGPVDLPPPSRSTTSRCAPPVTRTSSRRSSRNSRRRHGDADCGTSSTRTRTRRGGRG